MTGQDQPGEFDVRGVTRGGSWMPWFLEEWWFASCNWNLLTSRRSPGVGIRLIRSVHRVQCGGVLI